MVGENLTPDERAAVVKLVRDTIAADPYPLSPRIGRLNAMLAKLDPSPAPAPGPQPHLEREWGNKETAIRYLKNAGFVLRRDLSFAPPLGRKRLNPKDRRAIEYLVLEWGFVGLLTEAQHAERKRQKG